MVCARRVWPNRWNLNMTSPWLMPVDTVVLMHRTKDVGNSITRRTWWDLLKTRPDRPFYGASNAVTLAGLSRSSGENHLGRSTLAIKIQCLSPKAKYPNGKLAPAHRWDPQQAREKNIEYGRTQNPTWDEVEFGPWTDTKNSRSWRLRISCRVNYLARGYPKN